MHLPQRRRQRLVLVVCAWIFIVPGVGWTLAHLLLGHTQAAWHTTLAVLAGFAMLWALHRDHANLALALFCGGAWGLILLLGLTLDIPSRDVGRGIHHYLLPIFVAQRFVLQGRSPWVHQGVPAISLLLFVGLHLAGNPLGLESAMSEAQRRNGLHLTAGLSLLVCALLFRLQQVELRERGSLPLELARALRQQQGLALHLQPQVDALGRAVGAEALLRWPHPKREALPPARIVDVAARHGLLPALSDWSLQQALALLDAWQHEPPLARLRLAVNLSGAQLADADSREALLARLRAHPELCPRLCLELPEAVLAEADASLVRDFAQQVRSLGVQLALDRFGQGRSALQHLDALPLTQLKTDPALLQQLGDGTPATTVLQTVLDLGRRLGMEVLVHGVETEAQEQSLRKLGCDRLQGWRIAPALAPGSLRRLGAAAQQRMKALTSPEDQGAAQRAAQRLLRICLLLTALVHLQSLLRYAWVGEWRLVGPQLAGLLVLALSALLLRGGRQLAASLVFIFGVALGVLLQVLLVDRPSATLPRAQQLYLLPLMLITYELLPGRRRWLRNGLLLGLMLLYVVLAGLPALDQAPLFAERQRLVSALIAGAIVIALLVGLSQLADSGWVAQTELEMALARAIANGRLSLALQPQCDASGAVLGAEALVRWHDAERGWVPPAEFVPLAERSGLVLALGEQVLAQALVLLQRWQREPALAGIPLAVNLSALQLQDGAHLQRLLDRVAAAQLPAGRLKFELTETVMVAEPERMRELLQRCRAQGIATALDDFGTGYASLATLSQLPFEQLKIDQRFVRRLPDNPRGQKLARSLVELGQRLGMAVIAEGVETAEHVELLRAMGVLQFQGYHFARPMAPAAFEIWCAERAA